MDDEGRAPALAGVDLNLLVALDALLRERSVTRAGTRLSRTQPAMSGALARLRVLFGDDLLVREGRAMRLTPTAELLRGPVERILADIERTVSPPPAFDPARDERTFTIVASEYAALVILGPLLRELAEEAPGVRLRVQSSGLLEHVQLLERGRVDLAMLPAHPAPSDALRSQAVLRDRFVAAAWRGNRAVGERLSLDDLRTLPYLGFAIGTTRADVDRSLAAAGIERPANLTLESFVVGTLMLRGTPWVAFLQERLVRHLAEAAELRAIELPVELPPLIESIWWHDRLTGDPGHRWLRERIVAAGADALGASREDPVAGR